MVSVEIDQFADMVRQHHVGLRAFVRSLGVYSDSVDDLAQETFLTAWRRKDEFDPNRDFGKWLRGIARNLTLNERRKTARHSRILSGRLTEILEATTAQKEPVDESWIRTQLSIMRQCLDQAPEHTRSILVQHYQHGEPTEKLAAHLGARVEAVRQQLCRIRKALRDCIQEKMEMLTA